MSNIKLNNNQYWDWSSVVMPASSSDLTKCVNLGGNMDLIVEQDVFRVGVITNNYIMWCGSIFTNNGGEVTSVSSNVTAPRQVYGGNAGVTYGETLPAGNFTIMTQGHIRFNNGIQIIWKPFNANCDGNTPTANCPSTFFGYGTKVGAYYSTAAVDCGSFATFSGTAKPFIEKPIVYAKLINYPVASGWDYPQAVPFVIVMNSTASSWGQIVGHTPWSSTSINLTAGKVICLFAIGRWK